MVLWAGFPEGATMTSALGTVSDGFPGGLPKGATWGSVDDGFSPGAGLGAIWGGTGPDGGPDEAVLGAIAVAV